VLIKTKDILDKLLQKANIPYYNILPTSHRHGKIGILFEMFIRDIRMIRFVYKHRIDILTGSAAEVAQVAWITRRKAVNSGEDDVPVVPAFQTVVRPFLQALLTPTTCYVSSLENKTIHYPSYQELAYLHPNHFTPNREVVENYGIDTTKPYFIIRFSSLNAHHDKGIQGINHDIALRLVNILKPHGQIYITSERPLEPEFEPYRIHINPLDIHHVMAFASLYIGDSQTMAAEAGVLGTPFVRYNDFVGRIGYLDELEAPLPSPLKGETSCRASYLRVDRHYDLGVGIRASEEGSVDRLCATVERLMSLTPEERHRIYDERRQRMLADKIDYAKFLTWFVEKYPDSAVDAKNPQFDWNQFK